MKHIIYIGSLLLVGMVACREMPVTANPDDNTNANGTAGSARMTNQLPPKADNMPVKNDTIRLPNDSLHIMQ
jgi:hypothetical protein